MRLWHFFILACLFAGSAAALHVLRDRQELAALRAEADVASARGDFGQAHDLLDRYLESRGSDGEVQLLAGRCARRADFALAFYGPPPGSPDHWIEIAKTHLDVAEQHGGARRAIALERTLLRGQNEASALGLDALSLQSDEEASLAWEAIIHGQIRRQQLERALSGIDKLLSIDPGHAQALVWRGRIRDQLGSSGQGREDYENALQNHPDCDQARYYLAESLLRGHQASIAEGHLDILRERMSENLLVRLAWAKCRLALGDTEQGQQLLDAWLAEAPPRHPRLIEALVERANDDLASGLAVPAETFARRALSESPLDQFALHALARSLHGQGKVNEAEAVDRKLRDIKADLRRIALCRESLSQAPDDVQLRYEIGNAYLRVGRPGEAMVWFNSVLERDPKHRPTLTALAEFQASAALPSEPVNPGRRPACHDKDSH